MVGERPGGVEQLDFHAGGGMKRGDLIRPHGKEEILPPIDPDRLMGPRLPNVVDQVGMVLQEENIWGEDWIQALFPSGIGWVKREWVELVG